MFLQKHQVPIPQEHNIRLFICDTRQQNIPVEIEFAYPLSTFFPFPTPIKLFWRRESDQGAHRGCV